jgi:6-phosphogluconolactonase (cycloisomerase 2 family)
MQGIVQLFTNSSRGLLYALCKGSRNIKVFSIDPITNALAYEQTVSLASFSPSKAAISPNKENMLVVSDTNDQVLIFSIPQ